MNKGRSEIDHPPTIALEVDNQMSDPVIMEVLERLSGRLEFLVFGVMRKDDDDTDMGFVFELEVGCRGTGCDLARVGAIGSEGCVCFRWR